MRSELDRRVDWMRESMQRGPLSWGGGLESRTAARS